MGDNTHQMQLHLPCSFCLVAARMEVGEAMVALVCSVDDDAQVLSGVSRSQGHVCVVDFAFPLDKVYVFFIVERQPRLFRLVFGGIHFRPELCAVVAFGERQPLPSYEAFTPLPHRVTSHSTKVFVRRDPRHLGQLRS